MTGVILRNKTSATFTGRIDNVSTSQTTKTATIKLAGADKDVIQKIGLSNKIFTVQGYVSVNDPLTVESETPSEFLNNAVNYTGSIYWRSDTLALDLIPGTCVHFTDLEWKDEGSRPMERVFTLSLVEIK